MTENITAALVRADGTALYPIRDGIPVLLPDEVIFLSFDSHRSSESDLLDHQSPEHAN